MRVLLFAGAAVDNPGWVHGFIRQEDYIIACDKGLHVVDKLNLIPHLILGDFDSVAPKLLQEYKARGSCILDYPAEKDETDMELGMWKALEKAPEEIIAFGCIGSRLDHTLANLHLLAKSLENGCPMTMINENNKVQLIKDKVCLTGKKGEFVTLLPCTPVVTGVTTHRLKYPLFDATLALGTTRGVSNEFVSETACVEIGSGLLYVFQSRD